jgi:hypothetical protein
VVSTPGALGQVFAVNLGLGGLAAVSAVGGWPLLAGGIWLIVRTSAMGLAVLGASVAAAGPGDRDRRGWIAWSASLLGGSRGPAHVRSRRVVRAEMVSGVRAGPGARTRYDRGS